MKSLAPIWTAADVRAGLPGRHNFSPNPPCPRPSSTSPASTEALPYPTSYPQPRKSSRMLFLAEGALRALDKSRLLSEIRTTTSTTSLGQNQVSMTNESDASMDAYVPCILG